MGISKVFDFIKKCWRSAWGVPLFCAAFTILPIAISMATGLFGVLLGCSLNEAGTDPCVRFGIPFGDILYPFGLAGWFSLLTFPAGIGIAAMWGIWKAWSYITRKK